MSNVLLGAAAALGTARVVPSLSGGAIGFQSLLTTPTVASIVCVAMAIVVRYITEESEGEKT